MCRRSIERHLRRKFRNLHIAPHYFLQSPDRRRSISSSSQTNWPAVRSTRVNPLTLGNSPNRSCSSNHFRDFHNICKLMYSRASSWPLLWLAARYHPKMRSQPCRSYSTLSSVAANPLQKILARSSSYVSFRLVRLSDQSKEPHC